MIGACYAFGKAGLLMRSFGPSLAALSGTRGAVSLGLLFGLNIPACAAPLILALLSTAAISGGTVALGFMSLALFGLALSLPLVLVVLWEPGRLLLDRLASLSVRVPVMIGIVLIGLGLWSIYFGLFIRLEDWA